MTQTKQTKLVLNVKALIKYVPFYEEKRGDILARSENIDVFMGAA